MSPEKLLHMLDLHALKCLCVLVSESHVSRAAAQLKISQPAMSAMLAKLRLAFQDPLLARTAKGMAPTPNGVRIAANARAALALMEDSFALIRTFEPATADTTFFINATESVGFMLVPRLTQRLEQLAPHTRLVVSPSEPARMREQLEEGEVDLIVSFQPYAPETLYTTTLYEQPLRVLAAKSHPRIRGHLSVSQYLDERHCYYAPLRGHSSIERQVDEAFAERGHTRRIGVKVPSALASPPVVAASTHLATVTRAIAEHAARADDLQVFEPPFELSPVRVAMFWSERTHAVSGQLWLRQVIRELFHES